MKRILPTIVGALGFAILTPIVYLLAADGLPPGGMTGIVVLCGLGAALGAFLGWRFPNLFYWLLEGLLSSGS